MLFMKLSLVVPCYNEAENIELFQSETIKAFCGCGYSYEIIFVDDGSKDATLHQLKKIYAGGKCPMNFLLPEFRQGVRHLCRLTARQRRICESH